MKHDNCLGLLDVFTPAESVDDFSDVYIVTDLMSTDLDQLLKGKILYLDSAPQYKYSKYMLVIVTIFSSATLSHTINTC